MKNNKIVARYYKGAERNSYTILFLCSLSCFIFIFNPISVSAHVQITSAPTTACNSLDSLDLSTHASNQINSRLSAVSTTTGLAEYTNRPLSQILPWTRNPNVWTSALTPLDLTGVAGWTDAGWPLIGWGDQVFYTHGETLITPRHYVTANHLSDPIGAKIGFFDSNGNQVVRTVVNNYTIPNTDINVGVLDSDVPDSVTYYPLVSSAILKGLVQKTEPNYDLDVPILTFNQDSFAFVHSLNGFMNDTITHLPYLNGLRGSFSGDIRAGDSGLPGFIIIDNKPVLLFTHYGAGEGQNLGTYISEINSAISAMGNGNGYQVTVYNPTCFTQYPINIAPNFTGGIDAIILNQAKIKPSVAISTLSATDVDAGQTITFSLDTLVTTLQAYPVNLNPSDFLSINASTGQIYQINPINIGTYGTNLSLTVKATDSGNIPASRKATIEIKLFSFDYGSNISFDPAYLSLQNISPPNVEKFVFDGMNNLLVAGSFPKDSYIAPHVQNPTVSGNSILRFTNTGGLDPNFISGLNDSASVDSMFIEPDGKIVLSFISPILYDGISTSTLARLNSDGSLDTSFIQNAKLGISEIYGTVAAPFGDKIIVKGNNDSHGVSGSKLILLNSDGTVSNSLPYNTSNGDTLNNWQPMAVKDGDQIIWPVNITATSSVVRTGKIIRLNSDFSIDQNFSTSFGAGFNSNIFDVKVLDNNKILVVGYFTSFNGTSTPGVVLLNSDGTLNSAFENNIGTGAVGSISQSVIQPDGKILLSGDFTSFNGYNIGGLIRINSDGTVDRGFYDNIGGGLEYYQGPIAQRADGAIAIYQDQTYRVGDQIASGISILTTKKQADMLSPVLSGGASPKALNTGDTTSVKDIHLEGFAFADADIKIYDGDNQIGTSTSDSNGLWSSQVSLSEGSHSISVSQSLKFITVETSNKSTAITIIVNSIIPTSGGGGGGGSSASSNPLDTSMLVSHIATSSAVNTTSATAQIASKISRNINVGSKGDDVKSLQKFLNEYGFPISTAPGSVGSKGYETTYFGEMTRQSLIKFQKKYKISPADGSLGESTKKIIGTLTPVIQKVTVIPAVIGVANTTDDNKAPTIVLTTSVRDIMQKVSKAPRDLLVGSRGNDVKLLQKFLNGYGFPISTIPGSLGSDGYETTYFGEMTKRALIRFEKANSITPASGYLGADVKKIIMTLSKANK